MADIQHKDITGLNAIHPFAIRSATDPGAIGADKAWMDTSTTPATFKVRNAANTAWDTLPTAGANGTNGSNGSNGTNGVGVPVGGTAGQVLAKHSGTDYDTEWITPTGGGGGGTSFSYWDADAPAATPDALDDDFDATTVNAKWSSFNTAPTADLTSVGSMLRLPVTDTQIRGFSQPISGAFRVRTKLSIALPLGGAELLGGIAIANSAGVIESFCLRYDNTAGLNLGFRVENWTSVSTFGSSRFLSTSFINPGSVYLDVKWDGTIFVFSYSVNGIEFNPLFSYTPSSFTPNKVILYARGTVATQKVGYEWFRSVPASGVTGATRTT